MLRNMMYFETLHRHTRENHLHEPDWGQWFMNVPKVLKISCLAFLDKLASLTLALSRKWSARSI